MAASGRDNSFVRGCTAELLLGRVAVTYVQGPPKVSSCCPCSGRAFRRSYLTSSSAPLIGFSSSNHSYRSATVSSWSGALDGRWPLTCRNMGIHVQRGELQQVARGRLRLTFRPEVSNPFASRKEFYRRFCADESSST